MATKSVLQGGGLWTALLTPYTWAEIAERYQAVREAEARRAAALAGPR